MDGTLTCTITPGQSGPGVMAMKEYFYSSQGSRTGASPPGTV